MRRVMVQAFSASALALSLTGCVVSPQGLTQQYSCGYVAGHGRRLYVVQRPCYNYGYAPAPYYAPAAAQPYVGASPYAQPAPEPAAAANPTPLRSINPPASSSDSCVGWWRLCHLY